MSGASLHLSDLEVTADAANTVVVGPDDTVIIRAHTPLTTETAARILEAARRVLGDDRCLVLDNTFDIVICPATTA